MAKRLPIIISIFTVLASIGHQALPASALPIEGERPPEWSAIELLDYADVVYKRIIDACRSTAGITQVCLNEQIDSIMTENNKDSAFLYLRRQRTIIPSIDYNNGTVKFIYFDSDIAPRLQGTATSEPIKNAYVGFMQGLKSYFYSVDFNYLYQDRMEGTEYIDYSLDGNNPTFSVANNLIELKDHAYNPTNLYNTIIYSIEGTSGTINHRQTSFSGCIGEGYEDGMICRAMINGKGGLTYHRFLGTENLTKPINEDYSLYHAGYDSGYADGQADSYETGYNVGGQDGYEMGYAAGRQDGYEQGYYEGRQGGYEIGYDNGRTNGASDGYQSGYADGYEEGLRQGREEAAARNADAADTDTGIDANTNADVDAGNNITGISSLNIVTNDTPVASVSDNEARIPAANQQFMVFTLNPSNGTPLRPETGAPAEEEKGGIEVSWWIGAVFMLGLVTLCWLFWPARRKGTKKNTSKK